MVTIGIIKNPLFGGGGGSNSPIPFGELRLIAKGTQNGILNILKTLEIGDFVEGMKDARFKWKSARYNGGDITNRANYTPLVEVDLENDAEVIIPPVTEPGVIALPTSNYYYESLWEAADAINLPYINSWVDYIDSSGNLQHFILGGLENGCQLIIASSILNTNGCTTCILPVEPLPPVEPPINPPVLPTSNYYFQGIWEEGDTIHHPDVNAWVDYLDGFGNMYREIIGGLENGCQLITASSILGKRGCAPCTPEVVVSPPPVPFYSINISNSTPISNCAGAGAISYPINVFVEILPIAVGDIIYSDSALTSVFPGDNTWYSVSSYRSYRVNLAGQVTEMDNSCEALP